MGAAAGLTIISEEEKEKILMLIRGGKRREVKRRPAIAMRDYFEMEKRN